MSLKLLVELLDEEPGCGTKPPRRPPHPHADVAAAAGVPSYATRQVITGAYDAVRLYQLGHTAGGAVKELLTEGAEVLFDEYCGSVPLPELIRLLNQHWPQPPPSPMVRLVENLVAQYLVYAWAEEHGGKQEVLIQSALDLIRKATVIVCTGGGGGSGGPSTGVGGNAIIHLPKPIGPVPHFPSGEVKVWLKSREG